MIRLFLYFAFALFSVHNFEAVADRELGHTPDISIVADLDANDYSNIKNSRPNGGEKFTATASFVTAAYCLGLSSCAYPSLPAKSSEYKLHHIRSPPIIS